MDNDPGTRWGSATGADPQWITVDLGVSRTVTNIKLKWGTAYAKSFKLQISVDGNSWTDLYSTTTGTGADLDQNVNGNGRYVRMQSSRNCKKTEQKPPYSWAVFVLIKPGF